MVNPVLDQETFQSELEVVKNERRMTVEDSVIGELSERLYATAFAQHPYRWPTIGTMEHLEVATRAELERFYRTFYAPNNATVVVAGDIDFGDTLAMVAGAYGSLPAQALPAPARVVEPRQEQERMVTLQRPVMAPQIVLGFHAPAQLDPDYAVTEMLGEVLVVGDNARLYRRLVTEEALATDVIGYLAPFAEPGLYELLVTARPGVDPQRVIDVAQEELDRLVAGLSSAEVNKARNGLELFVHDSLKDAEGCAEALGHFESNYGDFCLAFTGQERWARVTDADLARVAAEVFRASNRTAVVAVPGGGE
jgi:zinc protease